MTGINFNNADLYSTQLDRCPLCGADLIERLYSITRFTHPFNIDRCGRCGFIFTNPRFNEDIVSSFYDEQYYRGTADYSYYDERSAEKYARHVWEKRMTILKKHAPAGNFLDIGAAFGGLMKCAEKYFTPYGIEISPYSGNHARGLFGNRVHIGTLEDHPFGKNMFSAITMIEVIEHLPDPLKALHECYDLLVPGGVLVLQTANMAARQARVLKDRYAYYLPGHLSYFTKKNLCETLKKTGFSRIKVYYPVEFGLVPKLLKSRYTFKTLRDYRSWLRITLYHFLSKIHLKDFAMTSSMVIYAIK